MKTRTTIISALALALLIAPATLVAQETEAPATVTLDGCLQPETDGTGFNLVDTAADSTVALEGDSEVLAAAAGNTVSVTGTPTADAEGNPVVQVEQVDNSGEACATASEVGVEIEESIGSATDEVTAELEATAEQAIDEAQDAAYEAYEEASPEL